MFGQDFAAQKHQSVAAKAVQELLDVAPIAWVRGLHCCVICQPCNWQPGDNNIQQSPSQQCKILEHSERKVDFNWQLSLMSLMYIDVHWCTLMYIDVHWCVSLLSEKTNFLCTVHQLVMCFYCTTWPDMSWSHCQAIGSSDCWMAMSMLDKDLALAGTGCTYRSSTLIFFSICLGRM